MRAICEVVVFLILVGIALPRLCRMRLPRAWAVAFPRERRAARLILLAFLAANVIYGGGKGDGDPPRGGESPNEKCKIENVKFEDAGNGERGTGDGGGAAAVPQWFVDYGYPADDSDGDGIPDCWERWTGTDPLVADSGGDLDSDGLSNLVEFWLQADPQCADTDNDGFGDAEEAAAFIAGIPEANPATPAPFAVAEPDADGDGIPDVWEDTGAPLLSGVDADGFPTGFQAAPATAWNYDILLRVTTSRHALLSWGDADSPSSAIIPPCDGQTLRLRLDASDVQHVTLSAVPGGATGASGAWRGGLSAEWDSRRELATDGNRVATTDGTFVDKEGGEGVRSEFLAWPGAGLRSGGGSGSRSLSFLPKPWSMSLWIDSGCVTHSPTVRVELVEDNVPPPYVWSYVGCETNETTNTVQYIPAEAFVSGDQIEVGVRQSDGIHTNLVPAAATLASLGHCIIGATNLAPIASLAGFDAVTNHAPVIMQSPIVNGGSCPDGTNITIYASWGGDSWERNFETIPTGLPSDDLTSHCFATNWADNLEIDLEDFLPELLMPYKDELSYLVNGTMIESTTIVAGKKPGELEPRIFHVEMCNEYGATLDRLWISVLNPKTSTEFSTWVSNNATNAAWLTQLPKPPDRIFVDSQGHVTLPPAASTNWNVSETFTTNSYMHPKAVYELRSDPISGGHGHQATYDADGTLITASIKAGTADHDSPVITWFDWRPISHRRNDVLPYIRALQLDGNPILPDNPLGILTEAIPLNLIRPPLRVGPCTQQYLDRRPTTPTGILDIP